MPLIEWDAWIVQWKRGGVIVTQIVETRDHSRRIMETLKANGAKPVGWNLLTGQDAITGKVHK